MLNKDQLFYDGQCPLCYKEIRLLEKLSGSQLVLVDVHEVSLPNKQNSLLAGSTKKIPNKELMLQRLHLLTTNGEWLLGLDATARAWSYTPYAIFFKILRLWPIRYFADGAYALWAKRRYRKRYECHQCIAKRNTKN